MIMFTQITTLALFISLVALPALAEEAVDLQIKTLTQGVVSSIKSENWQGVIDGINKIEEFGVEVPASLSYFKGRAYQGLNKTTEATKEFQRYIDREGKSGKYFKQAGEALTKSHKSIDEQTPQDLTIALFKSRISGILMDKTGVPSLKEGHRLMERMGVLKTRRTYTNESGKAEYIVGDIDNSHSLTLWLYSYPPFTNCYSIRFGPSENLSYHAHNRTFFEVCKQTGSDQFAFDDGMVRKEPGMRNWK